jgi:hypothetical protein
VRRAIPSLVGNRVTRLQAVVHAERLVRVRLVGESDGVDRDASAAVVVNRRTFGVAVAAERDSDARGRRRSLWREQQGPHESDLSSPSKRARPVLCLCALSEMTDELV